VARKSLRTSARRKSLDL